MQEREVLVMFPPELKTSRVCCRLWVSWAYSRVRDEASLKPPASVFQKSTFLSCCFGVCKSVGQHPSYKSECREAATLVSVKKVTGINSQDTFQKQPSLPSPDILLAFLMAFLQHLYLMASLHTALTLAW